MRAPSGRIEKLPMCLTVMLGLPILTYNVFSMEHFLQFVELWPQISNIQLHQDMNGDIT
jgi:hypothetical protein